MLTYKYVGDNAKKFTNDFDDAMIGPGFGADKQKYHEFVQDWDFNALQYDEPNDAMVNYNNWKEGITFNPNLIPILHGNYMQVLSLFAPNNKNTLYALGSGKDRVTEDEEIRRLPSKYQYHGLAKGRWVKKNLYSIDSSTWTSGTRGRKTDVWKGQSIYFGEKGRTNSSLIQLACQKNLIYLNKIGLDPKAVVQGDKDALMLAPIALYYMPMFRELGFYDENFKY